MLCNTLSKLLSSKTCGRDKCLEVVTQKITYDANQQAKQIIPLEDSFEKKKLQALVLIHVFNQATLWSLKCHVHQICQHCQSSFALLNTKISSPFLTCGDLPNHDYMMILRRSDYWRSKLIDRFTIDFGNLQYFLEIELVKTHMGIYIYFRKYTDHWKDVGKLGWTIIWPPLWSWQNTSWTRDKFLYLTWWQLFC